MLKLLYRRTLPANIVSYADTVLSLFKQVCSRFLPSLVRANNGKTLCRTRIRAIATKGWQVQVTVSPYWNKQFLMDALSCMSKQFVTN